MSEIYTSPEDANNISPSDVVQEKNIINENTADLSVLKEAVIKNNPLVKTYLNWVDEFNSTNEKNPEFKKLGFITHINEESVKKRLEDYKKYPRLLKFFRKETIDGKETLFFPNITDNGDIVVATRDKGRRIIPFSQDTNTNIVNGEPKYLTFRNLGSEKKDGSEYVQKYFTIFADKTKIEESVIDSRPNSKKDIENDKKLGDYIKSGDRDGAISCIFSLVAEVFGGKGKKQSKSFELSFGSMKNASNFDKLDVDKLKETIIMHEEMMKEIGSPQTIIKLTYMISYAKDLLNQKEHNKQESNFELLKKNIKKGDVLLIAPDRKKKSLSDGDDLLAGIETGTGHRAYTFTHSMLVDDPSFTDNGDMNLIHSSDGGVAKILFSEYLQNKNAVNIMILRPQNTIAEKTIDEMEKFLGKPYDSLEAVQGSILGTVNEDDKYNCVTAITKAMQNASGTSILKNATRPNEFLKEKSLTPIYMKTIESI